MNINFTKMHGCGNDYIYIDGTKVPEEVRNSAEKKAGLVRRLSDRHFGIGGDGVIFIHRVPETAQGELGQQADFEMEMYNADGSRAEMCGNGIRCVAKYVYDKGWTDKKQISVVSCGKVKHLALTVEAGKVVNVKVNMGAPVLQADDIPVISEQAEIVDEEIEAAGRTYKMTCVSMGNPHAVIFVKDENILTESDNGNDEDGQNAGEGGVGRFGREIVEGVGSLIEKHARFPKKTNVEFVKVLDRGKVQMRVWERGTGETLACGTGACAAVVAGILNGLTEEEVTVKLLGGELNILWDRKENLVYMTGPAETVFDGEADIEI